MNVRELRMVCEECVREQVGLWYCFADEDVVRGGGWDEHEQPVTGVEVGEEVVLTCGGKDDPPMDIEKVLSALADVGEEVSVHVRAWTDDVHVGRGTYGKRASGVRRDTRDEALVRAEREVRRTYVRGEIRYVRAVRNKMVMFS